VSLAHPRRISHRCVHPHRFACAMLWGMDTGSSRLPPRRRRPRTLLVALAAVAALATMVVFALPTFLAYMSSRQALPSLDESRRRVAGIQMARYAARGEHGSFLPPAAITVAVHEQFLQRSISASLPFEEDFDHGKIEARLDSVTVDVSDGATTITLRGRARLVKQPTVYADLLVQGTLEIEDIDFGKGRVVPHLEFTDVRILDAGPEGLGAWTNPVATYFTHRSAAEWNRFQPVLPLPLHFAARVELPAVEGDFSLPAIAFPVQARFMAVTALERRLVMSIELLPDSTRGAIAGPPTGPWDAPPREVLASVPERLFGLLKRPRKIALPPAPSADSIAALRERVLALAATDSLWSTLLSAEHDLTVLVPAPLLLSIVRSATSRYRAGVDVELDPEIVKHIVRPIRVKMLGQTITAGEVRAAIRVDRLRGRLVATGDPSVDLQPPDGLAVTMPLSLAGGLGTARFEFEWDPTAAAWLVCKGFKAEGTLDGMVGRIQHDVEGTLRFRVEDGKVVGRSALRRDRVRLPLDLTPASWAKVRGVFAEEDRLLRCGAVMNPDSMVALLRGIGAKGVRVRLPGGLPGFELPVRFGSSVVDSAYRVGVDVRRVEVVMTRVALVVSLDGVIALHALPAGDAAASAPRQAPR